MIRQLIALLSTPALIPAQLFIFLIAQAFESLPVNASPNLSVVRTVAGCSGQYSYGNIEYSFTVGEVASGFFINPDGYIVTNSHILRSLDREGCKDYALRNLGERVTGRKDFETIPQRTKTDLKDNVRFASDFEYFKRVILPTGDSLPFEIKKSGKPVAGDGQDLAIIRIPLANAPTVQFGDPNALKPQDPVAAIGYPLNEEATSFFARMTSERSPATSPLGRVAVMNGRLSSKSGSGNNAIWQVSASFPYGISGGPLVNAKGEVVGLVTRKSQAPGNNLSSVVPVSNLTAFVKEFASSSRDHPTDRLYREGLQRLQQGDFQGAKTSFEKVKELFPYNAEIYLLIHESEQKLVQAKQQSQRQLVLIGAGVAGVVVLAVYFLLKRKKKPRKPLTAKALSQPPSTLPLVNENPSYFPSFTPEPSGTPVGGTKLPSQPDSNLFRQAEPSAALVEPKSAPVELKNIPVEPKSTPVEPKSTPVKPQNIPVEGKSVPVQRKSTPVESKRVADVLSDPFKPPSDTFISSGTISSETLIGSQPFIELTNQDGQVKRFYLCRESHSLGRDRVWCDFSVPESGWKVISRRHALLVQEGDDYRIFNGDRTTPSTNGLLIDNTPITTEEGYLLQDGDEIQIGHDPRNRVILTYFNPGSRGSSQ